jgi:hypothetical protein
VKLKLSAEAAELLLEAELTGRRAECTEVDAGRAGVRGGQDGQRGDQCGAADAA